MNVIRAIGKYVDQPLVVSKCSKAIPAVLCGGAALYGFKEVKNSKEDKKKATIKTLCVLTGTVGTALLATRGCKGIEKIPQLFKKISVKNNNFGDKTQKMHKLLEKIFKGFEGLSPKYDSKEIIKSNTQAISRFLKENKVSSEIQEILEEGKSKILNPKKIKQLFSELSTNPKGKALLEDLIPDPEPATSKKILSEIGRLSLLGLVPVLGGISGGIIGDRITEKDWKQRIPNKIKEGSYQYLANIALCNVGAGAALGIMEKMHVKSKSVKAAGMVAGILAIGVIGGSAIANIIGKKFIDPLLGIKHTKEDNIYDERKPEAIDVGLHVDDIATVSVMSGLRWIEPALPILYSISGYRAGIGYRNGEQNEQPLVHTRSYNHKTELEGFFLGQKLDLGHNFSKETFKAFS